MPWGLSVFTNHDPSASPSTALRASAKVGFRQRAQTPARRLNFLLIQSPHSTPSLRSVAQGRLWLLTTDASRRIRESVNCPTQAKRRLEWATRLPPYRVLVSSTPTGSPPSDANTKHKVPFDFAQGRLSTPQIIAFAMISSGRDDTVGMFTRHRLGPANKLDCPHAMGTDAFSPQRAESFRHFLLLPSRPVVDHGRKPANLRVSVGAGAAQFQASGLRVRRHAGACSSAA